MCSYISITENFGFPAVEIYSLNSVAFPSFQLQESCGSKDTTFLFNFLDASLLHADSWLNLLKKQIVLNVTFGSDDSMKATTLFSDKGLTVPATSSPVVDFCIIILIRVVE
jgi:hypothetical protein